jgi:hypothetical protein
LLASGVATEVLPLNTTKKITTLQEADDLGLNATYDSTNGIRVYRHISEFFRTAGEGTPLYVMLYDGVPAQALYVDADTASPARKMVADSNGEIRQLAVAYSPSKANNTVDGLDGYVRTAITDAHLFATWAADTFRPLQVLLEGRGFTDTPSDAIDLRAIPAGAGELLHAEKVSVCIGQDYDYAETQDATGKLFADVGTMLGCLSAKLVNENIGEVETTKLTDTNKKVWLCAALSNHIPVEDMDSYLATLDDKGYIFAISYTGLAGYYWNNDHTCTPIIVDENNVMNESTISFGRVVDKAIRELRTTLLPKVKTTQVVDATTGKLPPGIVKYFEGLGDRVFDRMANVISAGKTTIDPDSNLLVAPRQLNVSFSIVPMGQIYSINGTINLKTQL